MVAVFVDQQQSMKAFNFKNITNIHVWYKWTSNLKIHSGKSVKMEICE